MFVMLSVGIPLHMCYSFNSSCRESNSQGNQSGHRFCFPPCRSGKQCSDCSDGCQFSGKASVALYVGVISLCALGSGILLDWIYLKLGVSVSATPGTAIELLPEDLKVSFAILLLPLML